MVTKAADCTQLVLDLDNKIMRVAKRFKSTNDPSITMEEDLHQKLKNIADSVGVHLEIKDNKVILTSDDEEKCVKAKAEARFRYSDRFRRNVEDTCRTWDFDVGTVWVAVDCKISLPSEITRRLEKQGLELESSYREGELTVYLRGPKAVMASAVKILQDLEKDVLLKEDRRVTGYDARHAPEAEEQVKSPEPAQPAQPAQPAVGKSAAESKGLVPQASVKSQEPQVAEKDLVEESDNNVMVLKLNDVVKRRLAEDEQSANELKEYLEMLSTAYSLNIIFVSAIGGIILEDLSKEADAMTKACDDLKAYIKEEFGDLQDQPQQAPTAATSAQNTFMQGPPTTLAAHDALRQWAAGQQFQPGNMANPASMMQNPFLAMMTASAAGERPVSANPMMSPPAGMPPGAANPWAMPQLMAQMWATYGGAPGMPLPMAMPTDQQQQQPEMSAQRPAMANGAKQNGPIAANIAPASGVDDWYAKEMKNLGL